MLVGPIMGPPGRPYVPFVFTLFMMVLTFNMMGIWLAVAAILRYSSVAALVAALGASIFALLSPSMPNPYILATVAMAGLLIWRHTPNIKNLIAGTETRIGGGKRGDDEEEDDA